ncbi:hypothetical protein B1H10_05130 [candidate division KSB1 bacterium 4484_188]|nr:MAG: hypothetical protein B1H10_05130 [candidate division KSB1 bacterium 4484_188]HFE63710.1 hypothetical protein [Caldithrix sp.]
MKTSANFISIKIYLIILGAVFFALLSTSCKDPLPPKIDPYQTLRGDWFFIPGQLKSDTLVNALVSGLFINPISISPYLVNEWDEWIVDTNYVDIHIKITLLNEPEVFQEYVIRDTTVKEIRLITGDSLWSTLEWNQRLKGKRVYQYLPPPLPNYAKQRMEYQVVRIRLEGTIQLFKNVLPKALPSKEILIFYWFKMS